MLSPFLLIVVIAIKSTSKGGSLYWSKRVGINNSIFLMPKFRTMQEGAPQLATHLLDKDAAKISKLGQFLRRNSIDEIPQLYSVLKGDMTLIGPRPALFNQYDLIELRKKYMIHKLKPGITGLAQINGRDENSISEKVRLDKKYVDNMGFFFDLKILLMTFAKVIQKSNISH